MTTFPRGAKDPEGREVQSEYHIGFGKILRDTDASGNVTSKEYDVFGRLIKVTLPGDEQSPLGTRTYQYSALGDAGSQHYVLKETETPGQEGTLDTIKYFDGMGRDY